MSNRTPTAEAARITGLLQPVIAAAGFDLEQVRISSAGRRSVLQIVVDADGGVCLDDVAAVGRVVSEALDAEEGDGFGQSAYTLEVSSPGVDRPLTEPRHWRRAAGRLVRTRIGDTPVQARVLAADDAGVMLDVAGVQRRAAYADLGKAVIQVEFAPPVDRTGEDTP